MRETTITPQSREGNPGCWSCGKHMNRVCANRFVCDNIECDRWSRPMNIDEAAFSRRFERGEAHERLVQTVQRLRAELLPFMATFPSDSKMARMATDLRTVLDSIDSTHAAEVPHVG